MSEKLKAAQNKAESGAIEGTPQVEKPKYPYKNFLEPRIVRIPRIQDTEAIMGKTLEQLPENFVMWGTFKQLELPRVNGGGGFVAIFDTTQKVITPQFPDTPMTELEFFSAMYGRDLSVTKPEDNFWAGRMGPDISKNFHPYTVYIPAEGTVLDLSILEDHLKYKVIKACSGAPVWGIAPSWDRRYESKSYAFAIVDEKIDIDEKKLKINTKLKATDAFNKIKDSREELEDFLITYNPNRIPSRTSSVEFLFEQVYTILEKNPAQFLRTVEDPDKLDKLFIHKCVKAGVFKKQGDRYSTAGDELLGTLGQVLAIIRDPARSEQRLRWEHQVKLDS